MRILFMGTPDFAIPSLQTLHLSHHELAGVVTTPDKPVGRGLRIKPSPVKKMALELNLPLFQPTDLSANEFVQEVVDTAAELYVVVAFRILPPQVFRIPAKGTINLHASLLPKYRGAAPINWVIINGETQTGLTTFFIQEKVDTGNLIIQKTVDIGTNETAGELHDRLAKAGAQLVLETVDSIERDDVAPVPQRGEVTKAPKLNTGIARISWQESNSAIHNLIRGLSPTPGAFSYLNGKLVKIYRSKLAEEQNQNRRPGGIVHVEKSTGRIVVAAASGSLELLELQLEGKRRMPTKEFLIGQHLNVGDRFA